MNKVLVTGADGFIGSHLVELLLKKGYSVKAFCLYNSFGSLGWLDSLPKSVIQNIEICSGDIRDYDSVYESMKDCDVAYHLAALIAIPYSYKSPRSYIETNINGTLNVLQAAKACEIQKLVHTSTSETYGTAQFVPITEDHPLVAQSPYAASKIGADQLALSFHKSYDLPVSILRPFNTYGPRQSTRAVIPTIMSQISSGKTSIALGALTPTRDFNFVLDTCEAFCAVAESNLSIGRIINSASNFEISIKDTALLIAEVMSADIEICLENGRLRPEASEVNRLFGDNSLLRSLTTWQPRFSGKEGFKKGISLTAEWFANPKNLSFYKSNQYQI